MRECFSAGTFFSDRERKKRKIAKIRTRKNLVPHDIAKTCNAYIVKSLLNGLTYMDNSNSNRLSSTFFKSKFWSFAWTGKKSFSLLETAH